ncbi:MAG: Translation initiation factor IF-2 [Mycoplasmataceae bacterium]|nr:MAG: Translation initiation factor IF-2 [Mycoplasmataceae bacterium]
MEEKNKNNSLFLEIVNHHIRNSANELKGRNLYLTDENISATQLSEIIGKSVGDIVAFFWAKGQIVNRNQLLTYDLLQDYCQSIKLGIKKKDGISFNKIIQEYLEKDESDEQLISRPPIVSIMGHIDHGKTTLLDTIRKTNIQRREAGGITQKVTISQVEFQGKKITFLDTPGHGDFIKMRKGGISLTDLVVLVIDAKDGIMSQTEEVINYLHDYNLPVIIFVNHKKPAETDNETNLNRIRSQCQEKGLTPLDWGGETIVISGNGKDSENVKYLLENILLLDNFKINSRSKTHGVIIDSYLHPHLSSQMVELLIQGGELKEKDKIFLNGKVGKFKIMSDINEKKIATSYSGDIVKINGLNIKAELGDRFLVINDEQIAEKIEKELVNYWEEKKKNHISTPFGKKSINLVLSADSQNSLEVLIELVKRKSNSDSSFSIIYSTIGNLNNFALDLTKMTESIFLVFGYQIAPSQAKILKENNISFFNSKIIYEIDEKLTEFADGNQKFEEVEEILGTAEIKVVFEFSKGNIAGCQVVDGKISRNKKVYILRGKEEKRIFVGEVKSLESNKVEKNEIVAGQECGIVLKGYDQFEEGDKIVSFQLVKKNVVQKK